MPDHDLRRWRFQKVIEEVGYSRSTILRLEKKGEFPPPIESGVAVRMWWASAVEAWLMAQKARSALPTPPKPPTPSVPGQRRRGRPPGSRNKPKDAGASLPVAPVEQSGARA
jgi:predicted DNA-binding transcriptional regulator AlpA